MDPGQLSGSYRSLSQLNRRSQHFLSLSLAPTTKTNYQTAFHKYERFCKFHHFIPFPATEDILIPFTTDLSCSLAHSSIKVHLAAISYHSAIRGQAIPFKEYKRLYYLLRGIKRAQGSTRRKKKRLPITPSMLQEINKHLFNSAQLYEDKIMLWAALLTAFFGFLRVSEYTSTWKKTFDPTTTLLFSDLHFSSDGTATILIKASKTDPFREGVPIRLTPNRTSLCPVNALRHLVLSHPSKSGPLFTFQNGRFLSRRDVNSTLVSTTGGVANISSHSLRIGAASTAAAAGCPKWLIQGMGRWSSDCFREYIRIPKATIKKTSKNMATCKKSNIEPFDPEIFTPA